MFTALSRKCAELWVTLHGRRFGTCMRQIKLKRPGREYVGSLKSVRDRQRRATTILNSEVAGAGVSALTVTGHSRADVAKLIKQSAPALTCKGMSSSRKRTEEINKFKTVGEKAWIGCNAGGLKHRRNGRVLLQARTSASGKFAKRVNTAHRQRTGTDNMWQVMNKLTDVDLHMHDLVTWLHAVAIGGLVRTIDGDGEDLAPARDNSCVVCFTDSFCADIHNIPVVRAFESIGHGWATEKPGAHSSSCIMINEPRDVRGFLLQCRRFPRSSTPHFRSGFGHSGGLREQPAVHPQPAVRPLNKVISHSNNKNLGRRTPVAQKK